MKNARKSKKPADDEYEEDEDARYDGVAADGSDGEAVEQDDDFDQEDEGLVDEPLADLEEKDVVVEPVGKRELNARANLAKGGSRSYFSTKVLTHCLQEHVVVGNSEVVKPIAWPAKKIAAPAPEQRIDADSTDEEEASDMARKRAQKPQVSCHRS